MALHARDIVQVDMGQKADTVFELEFCHGNRDGFASANNYLSDRVRIEYTSYLNEYHPEVSVPG